MPTIKTIRANADLAVDTARRRMGVELTFDRNGVEWVDGQLNRLRGQLPRSAQRDFINITAAFLGECLVRVYGGEWVEMPSGEWLVEVRRKYQVALNVFSKVEKQLAGVEGESVLSLFEITPHLAETGVDPRK